MNEWRKSSYSFANGNCAEVSAWRKSRSMPRHIRPGWLLYAGNLGLIAADVLDAEMSVQSSTLYVPSFFSSVRQLVRGPAEITFTAKLYEKKMQWDQDPAGGEPPHMDALLALARNHPDEYHELREREDVLKALGG